MLAPKDVKFKFDPTQAAGLFTLIEGVEFTVIELLICAEQDPAVTTTVYAPVLTILEVVTDGF